MLCSSKDLNIPEMHSDKTRIEEPTIDIN